VAPPDTLPNWPRLQPAGRDGRQGANPRIPAPAAQRLGGRRRPSPRPARPSFAAGLV